LGFTSLFDLFRGGSAYTGQIPFIKGLEFSKTAFLGAPHLGAFSHYTPRKGRTQGGLQHRETNPFSHPFSGVGTF